MYPLAKQDLDHVLEHTEGLWEGLRGERFFLTGGTGFVGSWLLETLTSISDRLRLDVKVTVLTRDQARFRNSAAHLANHRAVELLQGDFTTFRFPSGRGFPFVIHAANALIDVPKPELALGSFESDVQGTRRVLEFARSHGTRRLLFTSSGAVYGRQPPDVSNVSEDCVSAPATVETNATYAHAKRVAEFMCAAYGRAYGFDSVIARLFAFVGPGLPLNVNYAVGNFIRDAMAGGPIRISGDGTPYRSYLYAADLAVWIWTLLLRGESSSPYNVGSPIAISIAELARTVADATGENIAIELAENARPGAPPARYVPDTSRAATLGLRVRISLDDGVRRTIRWHREPRHGMINVHTAGVAL